MIRKAQPRLLLSAAVLGLAGCASGPGPEQPGASFSNACREVSGLCVAVRDLSLPRRSLEHFGRDLVHHGYLPVMLCLELDARARGAFNVRREDVRLQFRDGAQLAAAEPQEVFDDTSFSRLHTAFGFFTVLPGFVAVSSSGGGDDRKLEDDIVHQALEGARVTPGSRSSKGVVFFRLPEELWGDFSLEGAAVELTIHREPHGNVLGKPFEVTIPVRP
jgi:hypothetical protein